MKRGAIAFLVGVAIVFALLWSSSESTVTRIKKNEFLFCEGLGWINLGHAKPDATKEAFRRFQVQNRSATDSFSFCYTQKMAYTLAGKHIFAGFVECSLVRANLTPEEEKKAFLHIFLSVSNAFEHMQGQLPYSLFGSSRKSSFRDGDLAGDLISYYGAVSNVTLKDMKQGLPLLSTAASLEEYEQRGIGKKEMERGFY